MALIAKYQEYHSSEQQQEKYVLRGSILKCNKGSSLSRLDMPSDHGIEPPVTLTSDCVINANVHSFGTCSCRKDSSHSQCNPVLCNGWLQAEKGTLMIWNEITQKYEEAVKESAVLTCSYGGLITVEEVPQKKSEEVSKLLICAHGENIAVMDTLHPMVETVLNESIVLMTFDDIEASVNIDNIMTFSVYEKRATEVGLEYLIAGGDTAGKFIGLLWLSGLVPDASQEVLESFRQKGLLGENATIGELIIDAEDETTKEKLLILLKNYLDSLNYPYVELQYVEWGNYMKANPILTGKVGDVVIPMAYNLLAGESRVIKDMNFSMIIENGSGYTGYEFLHGTNENAGGFQIDGMVSKSINGDVTYDLTYTWNDIIDPNIELYIDDEERSEVANKIGNPKDYIIRIKWSEKTLIKANPTILNPNTGWLKNWSSDWKNKLNEKYANLLYLSEYEQTVDLRSPSWNTILEEIKEKYAEYYKSCVWNDVYSAMT